jgi:hypothetical protein
VTTSWSNPNSPPDGPQAQSLRAVLLSGSLSLAREFFRTIFFMTIDDTIRQRQQFADRYSGMTDDELLKLASESGALSDAAWDALEDELERRNLEVPEAEASSPLVQPAMRDLVLLRRFRDIPEALLAKGRLDASGINCFLADENMVRMDWFISNFLGGVKLLVEPADFTKASRVLNEPLPDALDDDEDYDGNDSETNLI